MKKNLLHISIFGTEPSIPDIKYKEFNQNKEMVFKVNYKQNVILKFKGYGCLHTSQLNLLQTYDVTVNFSFSVIINFCFKNNFKQL